MAWIYGQRIDDKMAQLVANRRQVVNRKLAKVGWRLNVSEEFILHILTAVAKRKLLPPRLICKLII